MKNIKLKIDAIKPCPWNTRGEISPESVKELAESINEVGLINPITLWESPQGEVYCVAGNRRLAALKSLGLEIEEEDYMMLEDEATENEAKMVTVTENLQREDVGVVEEAELVKTCLDSGMSIDEVAAKTGRGKTWVRVRAKLADLDEKWSAFAKAHPNSLTAEALEKIAAYPSAIQQTVWRTHKPSEDAKYGWDAFRWKFERESYDIEAAGICNDKKLCAKCKKCAKRTGAEADLFGETDGKLGRCLDKKCFEATVEAYRETAVKNAVGDAEAVVVDSRWNVPVEADGEKRTAKKPCAYVYFDGGDPQVKWGPSKAKLDEAKAEEEAEREAKDAECREKRKRIGEITEKLSACFDCDREDGVLEDRAEAMVKKHTAAELAFAVKAIVEQLTDWRSPHEWAAFLRTFGWAAELAGVSADDAKLLMDEFPEAGENENENNEE